MCICDGVGPSDGLFPLQDVNKNEYLTLIKYQTLLKCKHYIFCIVTEHLWQWSLANKKVVHAECENCP